jgi:hypothetical protein
MSSGLDIQRAFDQILVNGIVPTSRYYLVFGTPKIGLPLAIYNERLSLSCENIVCPGVSVMTGEFRTYGPVRKLPYMESYTNELAMSFRVGKDMYERDLFWGWNDQITNRFTHNLNYIDEYSTTIDLYHLDMGTMTDGSKTTKRTTLKDLLNEFNPVNMAKNVFPWLKDRENNPIYEATVLGGVRLTDCYPESIHEVPLGGDKADDYMKIQVHFCFYDAKRLDVEGIKENERAPEIVQEQTPMGAGLEQLPGNQFEEVIA